MAEMQARMQAEIDASEGSGQKANAEEFFRAPFDSPANAAEP